MPFKRDPKFDKEYGAYLVGESMKDIAKRLGVGPSVVSKAFQRRRFPLRSRWLVNEEQREVIKAMYATGDYTMQELADSFGYVSYVSVSVMVNNGKPKKRKTDRRTRKELPPVKICGYRYCDREVVHTYCRGLHMKLERSERAKDKKLLEEAQLIY